MTRTWAELAWPEANVGAALLQLARAAGLRPDPELLPVFHGAASSGEHWIARAADAIGVQARAVDCAYAELNQLLLQAAPALVCLTEGGQRHYLALLSARGQQLVVLTPRLGRARVELACVHAALTAELAQLPRGRVGPWLAALGVGPRQARRAREQLQRLVFEGQRIAGVWLLRADPGSPFGAQIGAQRALRSLTLSLLLSFGQIGFSVYGWVLLGQGAASGRLEAGWLCAWALTAISAALLQLGSLRSGWHFLHCVALWLKQRLLCGALRLEPDEIRSRGSGRLFAMVAESEALENAGLNGGAGLLLALLQLVSAACVLPLGAGGPGALVALLLWSACVGRWSWQLWRRRGEWTRARFALSQSFVQNVVGHRTRVAQQPSPRWHQREDHDLQHYLQASRALDAAQTLLAVLPARGWLLLGCLSLVPACFSRAEELALTIALGGILQAYAAFEAFSIHAPAIGAALVAWRHVSELFCAAVGRPKAGLPALASGAPSGPGGEARAEPDVALDVRGLTFRYRDSAEPALRACNLVVNAGERLLIEGPSGGGKSTLASLLTGVRRAQSGQVLLGGLDRVTLGVEAWLRRIASAPQFHENHVLSGTLAFNLLLGRDWPASSDDREQAERLCRELGLGPLLEKMPSGLDQIVGETGWQLSHGERSRIFLARALLQGAAVVILDESFGALDPLTLRQCLQTVLRRAPTLIVIAHP